MSIIHDIALTFFPHWSQKFVRLIPFYFTDREELFALSREQLHMRLPNETLWVEQFFAWKNLTPPETYQERIANAKLVAISRDHTSYPLLLQHIRYPPLVLFSTGNLPVREKWCAVVGSRDATPYGVTQATAFGKALGTHNIGVVSGLARGIDEHALHGALSTNGAVIAVLGGGHFHMSTRERELTERIVQNNGAVVSEHIPSFFPEKYHFPIRNRIIAGIAQQTLVVEAALKSGSLVTANKAIEENRDVFAVPGPITSSTSEGCHALIKDGAGLCTSVYDLLGIAPPEDSSHKTPPPTTVFTINIAKSPLEEEILALLKEPQSFDFLVECTKQKGTTIAGILNIWEIEGFVTINHGRYYLRHV